MESDAALSQMRQRAEDAEERAREVEGELDDLRRAHVGAQVRVGDGDC